MRDETCKEWLRRNGYTKELRLVEEVEEEYRAQGKGNRRDWYEAFAGRRDGKPRIISGRTFPIIPAIRERQGLKPVKKRISKRHRNETAPPVVPSGRWPASN